MVSSFLLLLSACADDGFAVVSLRPIFGWDVGCNTVKVSGHGFGTDVSARIGEGDVTDIQLPDRELDKGYTFTGVVPEGSVGYADVIVATGDQSSMIPKTSSGAYYFVACPGVAIDTVTPQCGVAAGAAVSLAGCGLDPALYSIRLVNALAHASELLPLTSDCRTGVAHFTVPAVAEGTWWITVVDAAGTVVLGQPCDGFAGVCDEGGDTAIVDTSTDTSTDTSVDTSTGDTGDTGVVCVDYPLVIGGAA